MDAGNESVGGGTTERNEEGGKEVKKKKKHKKTFCTFTRCSAIQNFSFSTDKQTDREEIRVGKAFKRYGKTSVSVTFGIKHRFVQ